MEEEPTEVLTDDEVTNRGPIIDRPPVLAEVRDAFERYEDALLANRVEELDAWFWNDARTVRFGIAETLYGHDEIANWRANAEPVPRTRRLVATAMTTFDDDVAVVDCEFTNDDGASCGRQSQTWVRFADGWKIVSAHVSMM